MDEFASHPLAIAPNPFRKPGSPSKQLFGEKGILGRSTSFNEPPDERYRKKGLKVFGGKIKSLIDEVIPSTLSHHIHNASIAVASRSVPRPDAPLTKFPVSLDPMAQAKLYAEVELMICVTANQFLVVQYQAYHISVESVTHTTKFWREKNRPQVLEFHFDQATQRELIQANMSTVQFHGRYNGNNVQANSVMQAWNYLAKEMSVRTFCNPDSTIRKHLLDAARVLEMLGARDATMEAFEDHRQNTLDAMVETQKLRDEEAELEYGIPKKWEPPVGKHEPDFNPFD